MMLNTRKEQDTGRLVVASRFLCLIMGIHYLYALFLIAFLLNL